MPRLTLAVLLLLIPGLARAQVVVNHAALEQLAGISAPPPPPALVAAPILHHAAPHRYILRKSPVQLVTARPMPAPAAVPPSPRAAPPPIPKPVRPPATAIDFAPGAADLPAGAPAALKPFCAARIPITISAAAPVDPADPSSAMRLAMMRAFAVRTALIACGTASANILPRTATSSLAKNPDVTQVSAGP